MKLTLKKSAEKYFKNNQDALKDYVGFSDDGISLDVNFISDDQGKDKICVEKDNEKIYISCPEKYFFL